MVAWPCFKSGRGSRTWTHDTWFWRPVLYQLSYSPRWSNYNMKNRVFEEIKCLKKQLKHDRIENNEDIDVGLGVAAAQ